MMVRIAAVSFLPENSALRGNADRLELAFPKAAEGSAKVAVALEGTFDGYVVNEITDVNHNEENVTIGEVSIPPTTPPRKATGSSGSFSMR